MAHLLALIELFGMMLQAVDGHMAPGAVPLPHLRSDWLQRQDRGLLPIERSCRLGGGSSLCI